MSTFASEMKSEDSIFDRTERLVGSGGMQSISSAKVIIFGVGGVGSWVAEALVRSGVGELTLVDSDTICPSNVNRQAPATSFTIGDVKVDAMKSKLLEINPKVKVQAIQARYTPINRDQFHLESYDYVIDAIDSLDSKLDLIIYASSLPENVRFFSSMGAALKLDPSQVRVAEFWKVEGCPLARAIRQRMKRARLFPSRKFQVVYSPERRPISASQTSDICDSTPSPNGSMVHVTAVFGFTLAGLVIQDRLSYHAGVTL